MTQTPKDTNTASRRPPLTLMQVIAVVGLLLALLVVLDFNQRLAAAQRMRDAADQAMAEVATLENERALLQTQVAYATTDAAVIDWAHEQGKAVQAGEVLVVPIIPTPIPTLALPTPAEEETITPWRLWWNLFFDEPLAASP